VFLVAIQNDGATDRIVVKAGGTGFWPVRYFEGRTEVTHAVVNGTYRTERLRTGERAFLKVKVRLGRPGTSVMRRLFLTSLGDTNRQDVVRLKVNYSACGC
jgi:hypothetical protein